jgi:transaldolase
VKIFLDSADTDEISQAYDWGMVDGVTTNPTLIKQAIDKRKTSIDLEIYLRTILKTAKGTPVSIEITETDSEKIIEEGKKSFKMFNHTAKNVCIKVPINTALDEHGKQFEGLKAIKELSKQKIPVNCTLVFTPEQALLAAKAGAKYISPFVGRIDDYLRDQNKIKYGKNDYFPESGLKNVETKDDNGIFSGIELVRECVEILKIHKLNSEIIAASMRNARQVREAALAGAHIATVPFSVLKELTKHQKTYEGMKKFTDDLVPEYGKLVK